MNGLKELSEVVYVNLPGRSDGDAKIMCSNNPFLVD
jgi:hypothetical protein